MGYFPRKVKHTLSYPLPSLIQTFQMGFHGYLLEFLWRSFRMYALAFNSTCPKPPTNSPTSTLSSTWRRMTPRHTDSQLVDTSLYIPFYAQLTTCKLFHSSHPP